MIAKTLITNEIDFECFLCDKLIVSDEKKQFDEKKTKKKTFNAKYEI